MELGPYEKIVIKDVESSNYSRDRRVLKVVFAAVALVFLLIYFIGFHKGLIANIKIIYSAYKASIWSLNPTFKYLVYSSNKMILLVIFMGMFVTFSLLAFFAFDILSRNRVIWFYSKRIKELEREIEEVRKDLSNNP